MTQRNFGRNEQTVERWPLRDRSESGVGITLKNEQSDWVRVGKLLGLRLDPTAPWRVGIIRRITRHEDDWRKIGVSVIPDAPDLATLEPAMERAQLTYSVDGSAYGGDDRPSQVLVFPHQAEGPALILESSKYAHGRHYKLEHKNSFHFIQLESVLDKGDGWLMASYFEIS